MILRPTIAAHPAGFGRRAPAALALPAARSAVAVQSDLRLFATTFAAGFLFVSVFLI